MAPTLAGSGPFDGRVHLDTEGAGRATYNKLFCEITCGVDGAATSTSEGAIEEPAAIHLPDGRQFHGVSYRGDIEGWRRCITAACASLGREHAKIYGGALKLSEGGEVALAVCKAGYF
ncbi:MAG: hypothetical protein J5J06_12020 [Phycisphaerae bacterium]|nr:hypothetical protein [Phycisphaerae bacterium]